MNSSIIILLFILAVVLYMLGSSKRYKNRNKDGDGGITIIGKDVDNNMVGGNSNKLAYEGESVEIPINLNSTVIMVIEDVFTITGRGTVVTGKIVNGELRVGDNVIIQDPQTMEIKNSTVVAIEQFRKTIEVANIGDMVGVLLSGVTRNDVQPGDYITK